MGFNNGYYIDDDPIEVKDLDEAYALCETWLCEKWGVTSKDLTEIEEGFQYITGYNDNDGNEMTQESWSEANENKEVGGYRYVYVTFEMKEE
jgi:hypothetical protein